MSQRFSEYARRERDDYPTPPWVTYALLEHTPWLAGMAWEPASGKNKMVRAIRVKGLTVVGTDKDFLSYGEPPNVGVTSIITNPPYGVGGRMALKFIEHALSFKQVRTVCMLLTVDFDSGSTRRHVFDECPHWHLKVVLLKRITWFEVPGKKEGPSTNHAWFVWRRGLGGTARIAYAG